MNNLIVDKTYSFEMPIGASSTNQTIAFPILQILDRKLLQGIEMYSVRNLTKSPSNVALANDALMSVSYLNLYVEDTQYIWNMPLIDLITTRNATSAASVGVFNPFALEFNNLSVVWAKCNIFIADITKIAVTNEVFYLNIKYTDLPKQ